MSELRIYYVRHAPVQHHRGDSNIKTFVPQINWPSSSINYVFSSPYQRCVQTAQALGIDMVNIDACVSEYQGHKNKTTQLNCATLQYAPPDCTETWQQFEERLNRHLVAMSNLEGNILVFTHGIVIKHLSELHFGSAIWKRAREVPFATCTLTLSRNDIETLIQHLS